MNINNSYVIITSYMKTYNSLQNKKKGKNGKEKRLTSALNKLNKC